MYLMVFTGLIVGLSLIFCAVYAFITLHRREDDDTEDSDGYLEIMMKEEVKT